MPSNNAVELARNNMIEQQVRPWDVSDQSVLGIMQELPREHFVPEIHQRLAFADIEIPINCNEKMMHPRVEGRVLQSLGIQAEDEIFELGTGSGFLTACLAKLGHHVHSIEIHPELSESAAQQLKSEGITNVTLIQGDACQGWDDDSIQYDAIAITASYPEYNDAFESMLKPGGRLFVIVGEDPVMEALKITKSDTGEIRKEVLFETSLPSVHGLSKKSDFSF